MRYACTDKNLRKGMEMSEHQVRPLQFSGSGAEYFRIWVVNVCLSIVTLGIYSAWAKVRRNQYFYRHTTLAGAGFDYHGDPKTILKGRIFAFLMFACYSLVGQFNQAAALVILAAIMALMPWLLVRSLRFRLHNTSYRGLRFTGKPGRHMSIFFFGPFCPA
jgi:uncharacterized membrane protein YjgN (DUF898 family)